VALDGARGVAIALVVLAHWDHTVFRFGGVVGVTLFFVLSGYLITSILLNEHTDSGRINLRAFYTRRALRLFPALALLVLALPFLQKLIADPHLTYDYIWWAGAAVLYVGNFVRTSGGTLGPLNHTWSLAVEEQFYLVWPLVLLAVLWWARGDARKLLRAVAALAAVATLWTVLAAFLFDFTRTYFAPDTNAFALMAGCALAAWLRTRPAPSMRGRVWPTYVALTVLVAMAAFPSIDFGGIDHRIAAHAVPLFCAAGLALILAAVACPDRGPLTWKPLTWLGTVSYGVYLWHAALLELAPGGQYPWGWQRAAVIAVSIVAAALSYYLLEKPLLRVKRRFEYVAKQRAAEPAAPVARALSRRVPAQRDATGEREMVSAATGR
jgi:peptidoglycan/LPS O-acetylase OafA/YrhL